jgi:polysaccharide pyruvyl transferase WcaK-like protein
MRILLDQAVHDHRNKGNNALLLVAMRRLRRMWPAAQFDAVSVSPHFCRVFLDGATPVSSEGLLPIHTRLDALHQCVPKAIWHLMFEFRECRINGSGDQLTQHPRGEAVGSRPHSATEGNDDILAATPKLEDYVAPRANAFRQLDQRNELAKYDLYLPTGGGYLCDTDERFVMPLLDRLESAVSLGVPTVMVGQGVGPLTREKLRRRAAEVLPQVHYIFVREQRLARPLLAGLRVPPEKVIMTGDDAIELAYRLRRNSIGRGLGLGIRVNPATEVLPDDIEKLAPMVERAAARARATIIAAPISYYHHESDIVPIRSMTRGSKRDDSSWRKFEPLPAFIGRVGRCRVMLSGTFHAAAFALAQGIPVVAVARSTEYYDKLAGLLREFEPDGGTIVHLDDPDWVAKSEAAIASAWESAERVRPHLLERARRQIDMGYAGYARIRDVIPRH